MSCEAFPIHTPRSSLRDRRRHPNGDRPTTPLTISSPQSIPVSPNTPPHYGLACLPVHTTYPHQSEPPYETQSIDQSPTNISFLILIQPGDGDERPQSPGTPCISDGVVVHGDRGGRVGENSCPEDGIDTGLVGGYGVITNKIDSTESFNIDTYLHAFDDLSSPIPILPSISSSYPNTITPKSNTYPPQTHLKPFRKTNLSPSSSPPDFKRTARRPHFEPKSLFGPVSTATVTTNVVAATDRAITLDIDRQPATRHIVTSTSDPTFVRHPGADYKGGVDPELKEWYEVKMASLKSNSTGILLGFPTGKKVGEETRVQVKEVDGRWAGMKKVTRIDEDVVKGSALKRWLSSEEREMRDAGIILGNRIEIYGGEETRTISTPSFSQTDVFTTPTPPNTNTTIAPSLLPLHILDLVSPLTLPDSSSAIGPPHLALKYDPMTKKWDRDSKTMLLRKRMDIQHLGLGMGLPMTPMVVKRKMEIEGEVGQWRNKNYQKGKALAAAVELEPPKATSTDKLLPSIQIKSSQGFVGSLSWPRSTGLGMTTLRHKGRKIMEDIETPNVRSPHADPSTPDAPTRRIISAPTKATTQSRIERGFTDFLAKARTASDPFPSRSKHRRRKKVKQPLPPAEEIVYDLVGLAKKYEDEEPSEVYLALRREMEEAFKSMEAEEAKSG